MPTPANPIYANGTTHSSNMCGSYTITNYTNCNNVRIRFNTTGYETTVQTSKIISGNIKDPLVPTVCGKGYFGVGKHKVGNIYNRWGKMIRRCYDTKAPDYACYGAKGVTVSNEFLCFQTYADWFIAECHKLGEDPLTTKLQVDKDRSGLGVYSREGCCLLTASANVIESQAKAYAFISPSGRIVHTDCLSTLCREQGLSVSKMCLLAQGKRNHHKQWRLQ